MSFRHFLSRHEKLEDAFALASAPFLLPLRAPTRTARILFALAFPILAPIGLLIGAGAFIAAGVIATADKFKHPKSKADLPKPINQAKLQQVINIAHYQAMKSTSSGFAVAHEATHADATSATMVFSRAQPATATTKTSAPPTRRPTL